MDRQIHHPKRYRLVTHAVASSAYAEGEELEIEAVECLRHLPGRRSVWRGVCRGESILLKVYEAHAKQKRDVEREWRHSNKLRQEGLDLAAPLFMAGADDALMAIAFEFITDGKGLADYLGNADQSGISDALGQLVRLHLKQHHSGCYQADDHLGNYLWSDGRVWMLDAGSCVFGTAPLEVGKRVGNMAMLAANIPLPLRSLYDKALAEGYDLDLPGLDQAIAKAICRRVQNYSRKTRRACSEFEHEQYSGSTWLACRDIDPGLKKKLLQNPDQFFCSAEDMIKNGRTCSVVDLEENGQAYVLKRYNQKSLGYRLAHAFMTPRVLSSWSSGQVLHLFGIATPRPMACYMLTRGRLFTKGYLLMEKIPGKSLYYMERGLIADPDKGIAGQFASRLNELETLQATHGDMKASNFILDESGVLQLIDLDSVAFHHCTRSYERRRAKDLKRFMRNWEDSPQLVKLFESQLLSASG